MKNKRMYNLVINQNQNIMLNTTNSTLLNLLTQVLNTMPAPNGQSYHNSHDMETLLPLSTLAEDINNALITNPPHIFISIFEDLNIAALDTPDPDLHDYTAPARLAFYNNTPIIFYYS